MEEKRFCECPYPDPGGKKDSDDCGFCGLQIDHRRTTAQKIVSLFLWGLAVFLIVLGFCFWFGGRRNPAAEAGNRVKFTGWRNTSSPEARDSHHWTYYCDDVPQDSVIQNGDYSRYEVRGFGLDKTVFYDNFDDARLRVEHESRCRGTQVQ